MIIGFKAAPSSALKVRLFNENGSQLGSDIVTGFTEDHPGKYRWTSNGYITSGWEGEIQIFDESDIQLLRVPYVASYVEQPSGYIDSSCTTVLGQEGPQGEDGPQGPPGLIGPIGLTGSIGGTGLIGLPGSTGDDGDTGSPGPMGPIGQTGITGLQGLGGVPGPLGDQGDSGDSGPPGPSGLQGPQGIQGVPGNTGSQGDSGIQGTQGIQGIQGLSGNDGIAGRFGMDGSDGDDGNIGPPGLIGPVGSTGSPGATGLQGPQAWGPDGEQGDDGQMGPPGPAGKDGVAASASITVSRLNADVSNSTVTAAKISGLDLTLAPGTYTFQYNIAYQAAAITTGVKFSVNHTGTVTLFILNMRYGSTGGANATAAPTQAGNVVTGNIHESFTARAKSTAAGMGPTASVDVANSDMLMIIEGLLIVTVSGNIELYHASEVAAASTIKVGSSLVVIKTA